jgi:ABC-type uncharacterized transport system involved in gliding motility auxiliary subunit
MIGTLRNYGHLLLNALGLLSCLVMAEVLIYRHNLRLDLTPEHRYTLSKHTEQILDSLNRSVKVLAFVRREDPRNQYLRDLLWRVNLRQPRVESELIDVNRNPSRARKYNVDAYGAVVIESGSRRKSMTNIREEFLMAGILQVTRDYEKTVYYLTGHGEKDFESSDRYRGFSTAKVALEQEFYRVKELSLLAGGEIPKDAAAVVIAGPRKDLFPEELQKLEAYALQGGALLVMLDPGDSPAVVALLRRFRVGLPDEVVADGDYRLAGSEVLTARLPDRVADSMVTATLDSDPVFSLMRPIEELPAKDQAEPAVLGILRSSGKSWALPYRGGKVPDDLNFVDGRDRRGPFAVGAAVLLPSDKKTPEDDDEADRMEISRGRVIVYGDSDFASNAFIDFLGNRDLWVNSVNWLALEKSLMGVRPARKAPGREQFFVSSRQGYVAFWLATVIEPTAFLLLGVAVLIWRRVR